MSIRNEDSRFLLGTPISDEREREREREISTSRRFRTLLHLLATDKSDDGDGDGDDRISNRWRAVKERLGFTLSGCCGCATWGRRESPSPPSPDDNNEGESGVVSMDVQENGIAPGGMNLAEALAAEREFRLVEAAAETPERVSLMRLLEAAAREREEEEEAEELEVDVEEERNDRVCCVCMVRKKGAAIIPCGHTFCRICGKEVWLNRGCCPLCNRPILDLLNIF